MDPIDGAVRGVACSIDIACLSLEGRRLLRLERARDAELPWLPLSPSASLEATVKGIAIASVGRAPTWQAPLGGFDQGAHPSRADISIAYVTVVPTGTAARDGHEWVPATETDGLRARQAGIAIAALSELRLRASLEPIAFQLLPPKFTLSELQRTYEVLLRRKLHKASFRRALNAANLIAETGEYRTAGRGRPALLYRHAPRRSSARRRPLPFDLLA